MPLRTASPLRLAVFGLLLCAGGGLFGACDGTGSRRAALYERLSNESPWRVEQLDGPLIPNLGERYSEVRVTFQRGGGRTYRMTGRLSMDSTVVLASGAVALPQGSLLQMITGFGRLGPVVWSYEYQASRAVFSLRAGSRAFLQALFPGMTWNDGQDVEMTLAPDGE